MSLNSSAPPRDVSTEKIVCPEQPHQAGDLLVSYLEQIGVEYVFGIPGGAIDPLFNALARSARRGGPRAVVARHETGAAFMADGYARETGRLGVCCSTTGPGATNLITGVACAYQNDIPVLALTAQTALPVFGKGAFQESSCTGVNILGMFEHCTSYNSLVSHPQQLETKLIDAIVTACRSRTTAHLSLPLDVMRGLAPVAAPSFDLRKLLRAPSLFDGDAFEELCGIVAAAKNPVILMGGACEEAAGVILEFALLRNIPVVTTPHGKGLINAYHPLYRGVFGFAGHRSAHALLAGSDLVLAAGTVMGEWDSGGWDEKALLNNRLVQINETEKYIARSPMARLHVQGQILMVFERLVDRWRPLGESCTGSARVVCDSLSPNRANNDHSPVKFTVYPPPQLSLDEETSSVDCPTALKPQRLMQALSRLFPLDTRFLADTGNGLAWAIHCLHPRDRRLSGRRSRVANTFRSSFEYASMGWAIGAAVGTALSTRRHPVVCIAGDGSFLMSGQEITVAVQEKLSIIFVILNDGVLGMVMHGQRLGGSEPMGFELPPVNYCAMAQAMGVQAFTVRSPDELTALDIRGLCRHPGPTLLDVHIEREEVPPMRMRAKVLGMAVNN